jgi:hypothetical protein
MREVKNAHACGAETVFFSDDNFFINRAFTFELLREIIAWNRTLDRPLSFSTQATVQIGADEELLEAARRRALQRPLPRPRNPAQGVPGRGQQGPDGALRSARGHPAHLELRHHAVSRHDRRLRPRHAAVFSDIEDFLDETGSPIASISVLNAPRNTALYRRMQAEGACRRSSAASGT